MLPREEELKAQQAMQLMQEGNYTDALPLLKDAWQLSNQNGEIGLLLAETLIALNRSEDAEAVLKTIPLQDQDTRYQGLVAQIELLKQAADTPEIQQLQQQVAENPEDAAWRRNWRCNCIRLGAMKRRWSCCSGICVKISPPQTVRRVKRSRRSSLRWVRVMHWRRSIAASCMHCCIDIPLIGT